MMNSKAVEELRKEISKTYHHREYPCLLDQYERWRESMPLSGIKVFDGSPVFINSLPKYVPLLISGARLTIGVTTKLPSSKRVFTRLRELGVEVVRDEFEGGDYDLILDCAGIHHCKPARRGYVELTRTGELHYRDSKLPCFTVDRSRIKIIEDRLGSGDGFMRALADSGHGDCGGRTVVVFGGYGKVGSVSVISS